MSQVMIDPPLPRSAASPSEQFETQPAEPLARPRRLRLLAWLAQRTPTLCVMVALVGLGVYGHHTDWKLPKFSTLTGNHAAAADDWCEEHGVPESQCVECHPDLLPRGKDYGWCKAHGVHNCALEHPDVAQLKKPPLVTDADRERAARALATLSRPDNNSVCKNYRRRIQFASLEGVKKAGVDVALVVRQPIVESISATGQITYDQTRFASLSSRLPGTVWQVEKNVGDRVRAGEVLALVDAAEVGKAKSELMQALVQEEFTKQLVDRLASLSSQGIVAGRQAQTAQADYVQARARLLSAQQSLLNFGLPLKVEALRGLSEADLLGHLRWLGIPESISRSFPASEATANLLPVRAPLDAVVVERQVVAGEAVDASRVLFQLADTSRMWLTLNVSVENVGKLGLGQAVRFQSEGVRDEAAGTLVWISTTADQQTRMVTVRAELLNPQGQLRNETFAAGRIILREEPEVIAVPKEAVHWEGDCHIVFVRDKGYFDSQDSPKVFHIRTVRLGASNEKSTEIIAGILPGEVVATKGSDVLRAELLKNSLGEGCCAVK
jgi:multidrug efflux pump subunit AcrA (membrane-fusion protein)